MDFDASRACFMARRSGIRKHVNLRPKGDKKAPDSCMSSPDRITILQDEIFAMMIRRGIERGRGITWIYMKINMRSRSQRAIAILTSNMEIMRSFDYSWNYNTCQGC